jgi:hypothetical protein
MLKSLVADFKQPESRLKAMYCVCRLLREITSHESSLQLDADVLYPLLVQLDKIDLNELPNGELLEPSECDIDSLTGKIAVNRQLYQELKTMALELVFKNNLTAEVKDEECARKIVDWALHNSDIQHEHEMLKWILDALKTRSLVSQVLFSRADGRLSKTLQFVQHAIGAKHDRTSQFGRAISILHIRRTVESRKRSASEMEGVDTDATNREEFKMLEQLITSTPTPDYLLQDKENITDTFNARMLCDVLNVLIHA